MHPKTKQDCQARADRNRAEARFYAEIGNPHQARYYAGLADDWQEIADSMEAGQEPDPHAI